MAALEPTGQLVTTGAGRPAELFPSQGRGLPLAQGRGALSVVSSESPISARLFGIMHGRLGCQ